MQIRSSASSRRALSVLAFCAAASLSAAQSNVPIVSLRDARLTGSDSAIQDGFGGALALSGNTALVGSLVADTSAGFDAGAAYVFVRTASGWVQQAKLVASDAAEGDRFGIAVAIDGDRAAVGAVGAEVNGVPDIGAVYVFERTGSTWTQVQKLVGIGADIGEGMGWSLALQGDTLVAGAADDHHSGGQITGGAAYVFVHGASGWTQQQRVAPNDGSAFDYFGHAVSLDGDSLVCGSYSDNHPGAANGGSVYVFQRTGTVWSQVQKIIPADNGDNDLFGFALALQGDELVAGAVGVTVNGGYEAGATYVFHRGAGGFAQTNKILEPTPGAGHAFGSSVALDDDVLVVGAVNSPSGNEPFTGSVNVYQGAGSGFSQEFQLRSTMIETGSAFGMTAALSNGLALIGAPGIVTSDVGSVFVYRIEPAIQTYCTAKVNSLGCSPQIGWNGTPSLSSSAPFDVTAHDELSHKNGLLFYGYGANAAPFQGGTLCVAAPIRRTPIQNAGGTGGANDCSGAYSFDFNAYLQSGADPELFVGSEVFAQYWSRDPASAIPTGLSDGLHFHLLP